MTDTKKLHFEVNDLNTKFNIELNRALETKAKIEELTLKKKESEEKAELSQKSAILLKTFIVNARQNALGHLEKIGTFGMQTIAGSDFFIKFNTYEDKRKEGSSTGFKISIDLECMLKGEPLCTPLVGFSGGGLVEGSSFIFRTSVLDLVGYKGPLILDETNSSVSNDDKIYKLAEFFKQYINMSNRQTLFVTHDFNVFGSYADNIIYIYKEDTGETKSKSVSFIELQEIFNNDQFQAIN